MSVKEANKIDGIGIDEQSNTLVFLITDPFNWAIQESEHLKGLQTKINNYVGYIESKQYSELYSGREFEQFRIEIVFRFQYTENCEKFLKAGKEQLKQHHIDITYTVTESEE